MTQKGEGDKIFASPHFRFFYAMLYILFCSISSRKTITKQSSVHSPSFLLFDHPHFFAFTSLRSICICDIKMLTVPRKSETCFANSAICGPSSKSVVGVAVSFASCSTQRSEKKQGYARAGVDV